MLVLTVALGGCGSRNATLGTPPEGTPASIAEVRTASATRPVVLRGKLVEKCPVAGCWFIVRDSSGTMKIDTKAAGFVVVDVPLGVEVTVAGRTAEEGAEKLVEATGIRY